MGITNSIRVLKSKKKLEKMKISGAVLFALASADDRKVPPRHPLQRLTRLTEFSAELLNQWYTWLPSKNSWVAKFEKKCQSYGKKLQAWRAEMWPLQRRPTSPWRTRRPKTTIQRRMGQIQP